MICFMLSFAPFFSRFAVLLSLHVIKYSMMFGIWLRLRDAWPVIRQLSGRNFMLHEPCLLASLCEPHINFSVKLGAYDYGDQASQTVITCNLSSTTMTNGNSIHFTQLRLQRRRLLSESITCHICYYTANIHCKQRTLLTIEGI